MTRQEFIEKMRALFPQADGNLPAEWAEWLAIRNIPYESTHKAFFGVHQQYGGEIAGLLYIKGPNHYCLYPNEFTLAAEYLYEGGTIEQIDERPTHSEQESGGFAMKMRQGGY